MIATPPPLDFEKQVTLRQLRYLVTLGGEGSFTRAAARCGISQPSLSQAIRQLEDAIGAPLVERGARAFLTPLGREVAVRAQRILLEVRDLGELAGGGDTALLGTIRLGVTPTIGAYLLPRLVARLHQQFHDLRVHVRETPPAQLVEGLAAGTHDVILAQLPLQAPGTHAERLFREPLHLAMAADHPLAARTAIGTEDLAGQDLLTLQRGYRLAEQTIAIAEEAGARVRAEYEGTSLDAIRQMAGMGMGLAVLPELYVRQEIRPGDDVVSRPFRSGRHYRELGLLWRSGVGRAPAYKRLAEELVACVEDIGISYR
ncbi:Hydrogen peroxide-inducible genes activator [Sphingomonas sp. S2M10]|jgi:LysR family hydrogen peroxide-inducible transcriptional activator|uniref:hydrogen peroxide-inducible genes activator n=1 Tax=Sphingomonas sp. S2M10 TaxID=2705010 RepID=UPI0014568CED|nr:hydrogen peroxide-inducible genes activator [Sphingomonas sp. S2M10]NLS25518.1 Hydrogen peroxide-inducible genes activator [Sphingomonas sp. S2M10]